LRKLNKDKVSAHVRRYLKLEGADDWLLNYATNILGELGYTDSNRSGHKNDAQGSNTTITLENLNRGIETEELEEKLKSSNDFMSVIAKRKLTYTQINLMGDSEKHQYADLRKKEISGQKASLHIADEDLSELLDMAGIKSKEDEDRKSTQIPPKQLWGKSDTYDFLLSEAEALECVVKYLYDVAKQVYVFKLGKELDKELQTDLKTMHDQVIIPMCKMSILKTNMVKYILDNVQDEKNRDTLCGWIQKAVHKFLDYGNHGTGEVDFIETGEHIMKLGNTGTVIRIPIKREFTREQVSDKTTFELTDETNQMFITCPQCKLEWNKPIITDEKRDVIAGDYFNKALNILLNDPVNRVVEKICDNVIILPLKTPEQFLKEEYAKKNKDLKGIDFKSIKVVNEKPTKIKEEDIKQSEKTDIAYNIFYGRSNRTWAKAEYFSDQA
jgi:hypothetical protein